MWLHVLNLIQTLSGHLKLKEEMRSWCECTAIGDLHVYLGHVLRIRDNKHPWWRFLVDGHDIPAETDRGRETNKFRERRQK